MSDADLFSLLSSCNTTARETIADHLHIPFSLLQDFVHGHCCLDEDLVDKIASAVTIIP